LLLGLPGWWARRNASPQTVAPVELRPPVVEPEIVPPEVADVADVPDVAEVAEVAGSCLQRLPPALGTELIAVRSELQYVRVYTTRGDALVLGALKDIAEQLRPTVAEMVKQELANTQGDKVLGNIAANIDLSQLAEHIGESQLAYLAEHLSDTQLVTVGENVSASDVAAELSSSQLSDIASDIDLADLAGEFDADKIMENYDLDDAMRNFFSNNTFSIRA